MTNVGIYKITSPSGKVYIGQSRDIKYRFQRYRRLSCKSKPKILSSLTKYGSCNHSFDIIHSLPLDVSQDIINKYEVFYMELYTACGIDLLNIKGGGSNGRHSEE